MNQYEVLMANKPFTWLRQGQFVIALLIYMTLLFLPSPSLGGDDWKDFFLHVLGNGLLVLSTWVASGGKFKGVGPLLFVLPVSFMTELAQGLTDNRTPQLIDIGANFLGALLGFLCCIPFDMIVRRLRLRPSGK